jgi:D-amino peptidase
MEGVMKTVLIPIIIMLLLDPIAFAQIGKGLKIFISVDMEGITGVVNWEEVSRDGKDYDYFRKIMTKEANAAIEGALEAGATEILVRDSHGSARNILPEMLNRNARLLRDWSGGFKSMMEGLDETFDAVIFIGYHAKAGTPNALLEHTMSGNIADISINGVSLPEAGINALIAGHYNVPVVFLSGDLAICKQAKELFGEVETVAVKEGIGNAALNFHPEVTQEKIREGVKKALSNLSKYKSFKLKPPFKMVLKLKREELVQEKSIYPGAKRTGDWELTYENNDLMEVMKAFNRMH